ncbi:class I SAM-dependent methyltransferase [Rhizobium sp. S152]|uniref:class I SAM-dependent methyltransferase n=1 Tax=Rhizobium sp. S152 TaxID=3055038 RepID=UPI0025A9E941|nr:class I SAM-dependent methyltransferase [Rhizobium sp. S152]MDM9624449.1 class I SAM-dependent methyltransferase [Rhizobium sp. S152]
MDFPIRKFIFHDLQSIDGYIDPPDALVFLSLLRTQQSAGLEGGVAEIGVYYGRSYFLFRKICGDQEKIIAIDLFDVDQNGRGTTQYDRFLDNGRSLDLLVDEELVIKGDSTLLAAEDITDRAGVIRFFSIDGGHMLNHVASDSRLAAMSLAEHGIIAFDDTFNPAWPEVTVGVADFLREQDGQFAVFCLTKYKTYVCRQSFHMFYSRVIEQSEDLKAFDHAETDFLGSKAVRLNNPVGRRIVHELLARSGLGSLSERVYR